MRNRYLVLFLAALLLPAAASAKVLVPTAKLEKGPECVSLSASAFDITLENACKQDLIVLNLLFAKEEKGPWAPGLPASVSVEKGEEEYMLNFAIFGPREPCDLKSRSTPAKCRDVTVPAGYSFRFPLPAWVFENRDPPYPTPFKVLYKLPGQTEPRYSIIAGSCEGLRPSE